ncbi:MAG: DUF4097 family beta strand repeat-containing protein, partial [Gemmatimonadales bacterium]
DMSNGTVYRRGSVFGALLLIGIGGLFLYANFRPEFSPWPLLAKYWPVLIIFWGLGKLVDYLMLRGGPEAAAAARLSGGDIFGLLLLLLFGSLFSRAVEGGWRTPPGIKLGGEELACFLGSEYEFSDERAQTVTSPTTLRLSHTRGNLTLTGGTGDQIRIVARKKICATSEAEANRLSQGFEPVLESTGEGYEFRWKTVAGASESLRADLDLQLPPAVNLQLSARRGDVRLKGVQGNVQLALNRGETQMEDIHGDVSVELDHGSVRLAGVRGEARVAGRGNEISFQDIRGGASLSGEFYGPLRFAGIGGPIRFTSRRTTFNAPRIDGEMTLDSGRLRLSRVPGDVSLLTRDKDIEVEDVTGALQIENRDGPVVLRFRTPPTRDIEVENRSADIELYLPENSGFEISASARDGEIESDFTGSGLTWQREERGSQALNGTYGTRRASIQLSTTYGTIHLRRASPAPPATPASPTR